MQLADSANNLSTGDIMVLTVLVILPGKKIRIKSKQMYIRITFISLGN